MSAWRCCSLGILVLGISCALPPTAQAQQDTEHSAQTEPFSPAGKTPTEIIAHHVADAPECQRFDSEAALEARVAQWQSALADLDAAEPGMVLDWLAGKRPPPRAVLDEASLQRNCLVDDLVAAAAEPKNRVIVDALLPKVEPTANRMSAVAREYAKRPAMRQKLRRHITRSHYRSAEAQARIWKRKHTFVSKAFHQVSANAAEKCGLKQGRLWRPGNKMHDKCWKKVLEEQERELEILRASSAPGISRHHWGTDADFLSLSAARFGKRGKHHDEWQWMRRNALLHGWFQPYQVPTGVDRYIEERWHWSYYPIAEALTRYAKANEPRLASTLDAQWTRFEAIWNSKRKNKRVYFEYVRLAWRGYVFSIDAPERPQM